MSKPTRPSAYTTRPGQKTFRASPDLLRRIDERAEMETALLGMEVAAADIIRRGVDWVLEQPLPGRVRKPCNMVNTAAGTKKCLACFIEVDAQELAYRCQQNQEVYIL